MDSNWKCLSWAGNICQKIEEIFPSGDDIVFQESIEFVHNQIQAAGVNVKQFCSAFVDDVFCQSSSTSSFGESAHDSYALHSIDSLACENTKLKNNEIAELESSAKELFKPCLEEIVAIARTKAGTKISSSMESLSSNHHDSEIENNEALISCPVTVNLTGSITLMKDEETGNNQVDSSASTISSADKTVDSGVSPLIEGGLSKASIDNSADSISEGGADSLAPITMSRKTIQLANEMFIMVNADELESMYDKINANQVLRKSAAKERRYVPTLRRPVRREYVCLGDIEAESQILGGKTFSKPSYNTPAVDDEHGRHREVEAECQIHGGKSFAEPSHVTTADEEISEWEIIKMDSLLMN